MNLDQFGKLKIWHPISVAIYWDNFSQILRPNLPEKLNGEHFEKNKHQNRNHTCPYAKLQSTWRIPDCGTKFGQKKA